MNKSIFSHYRKLLFFLLHRFEKDNYKEMRNYLAEVLVKDVSKFVKLQKAKVLDIGGANGEFCAFLEKNYDCDAVNLEPFNQKKFYSKKRVKSFGDKIPFKDNYFDFVICRGVIEHIPSTKREETIRESYRVLKKKGVAYFVFPPWYNPHAGHMLKPFHVLPFGWAKKLRKLFFNEEIDAKSYAEATLHPVTFRSAKKMFKLTGFKQVKTLDTHLRLNFLTKIPLIREFCVPAVAFILEK